MIEMVGIAIGHRAGTICIIFGTLELCNRYVARMEEGETLQAALKEGMVTLEPTQFLLGLNLVVANNVSSLHHLEMEEEEDSRASASATKEKSSHAAEVA
ncbi:hypothetical protein FRX31_027541 [Thalictrum thalictroides]|uniref:Uncharacterized protein n=1 Tax=Thalictrum thalictroides TaxID=46969 RepID=A0A7J6VF83_THATH|nr:hypothetical protein FRX31_027541 [Thalictrum thalictroides]